LRPYYAGAMEPDACLHAERVDGRCVACGDCVHEVILNGACLACGSTAIDPVARSPRPELVSVERLRRKPSR
jgi:hypothetical protein